MKYYKNIENGYIVSISTQHGQTEITKEEYENILQLIKTMPQAEQDFEYRLKEDLTLEKYELPQEEIIEGVAE